MYGLLMLALVIIVALTIVVVVQRGQIKSKEESIDYWETQYQRATTHRDYWKGRAADASMKCARLSANCRR